MIKYFFNKFIPFYYFSKKIFFIFICFLYFFTFFVVIYLSFLFFFNIFGISPVQRGLPAPTEPILDPEKRNRRSSRDLLWLPIFFIFLCTYFIILIYIYLIYITHYYIKLYIILCLSVTYYIYTTSTIHIKS